MEHQQSSEFTKTTALIGGGYWGKNLARNLWQLGTLRTLCDVNESLLDQYQEQYPGLSVTTNVRTILEDPEIKQVVIATPGHTHFELAKQVLLSGRDLYVEKPLCLDSLEGQQLVEMAEERGLVLMVGHILQYHPCVRKVQEMLKGGAIGKLQYIVSNRLNLGKIQTKESALWSYAPHDISVILSLCGNQVPTQVRCHGAAYLSDGIADVSLTTMTFSENVKAHIYVSWLNPFKEQRLVVVGSSGMLVFDDTKPWDDKLLLYRDPVTWTHGNIPIENKQAPEKIVVTEAEPLKEELRHFMHCCSERMTPVTDGKEGMRVLKVLQAAEASNREDGEIKDPSRQHSLTLGEPAYQVHPSAIVDPGADIGAGTHVWHFSHIMGDTKVGANCRIGQNVVVSTGVTLGRNVKVQNNVSIYSGVVCEDDVFLGPSMVFTNIVNPRSEVVRRHLYQNTVAKRGATVGANATIICGVTLGEYCFIGAGAVVTKDVKPYALITGNPGRQSGWMSRHGERLDLPVHVGENNEMRATCPETGDLYVLRGGTLTPVPRQESEVDNTAASKKSAMAGAQS